MVAVRSPCSRLERLAKRRTLADHLAHFQAIFRKVAATHWVNADVLLRPAKRGCGRLVPLGFHTCLACTSFLPYWPSAQQRELATRLLALRGGSALTLQDLDRGVRVAPAPLSLATVPGVQGPSCARGAAAPPLPVPPLPFQVRCPKQRGRVLTLPGKPLPFAGGKACCGSCQSQVRLGMSVCVACDKRMSSCTCPQGQPQAADPHPHPTPPPPRIAQGCVSANPF